MSLISVVHPPAEETIHGVLVRDPYRWLEDRSLPETEAWIRIQQRRCEDYFANREDLDPIRERVRQYLDIEVYDQPARVGNQYFYRRRGKGQEQASIYTRDCRGGEERLLIDPSSLGRYASVGIHRISPDASLLAYELKQGGGDRKSIHMVEVASGRILPDFLETGYARGFAFAPDLRGFYYCHELRQQSEIHTIRFHAFGQRTEDQSCFFAPRTPGSRLVLRNDSVHLGAVYTHRWGGKDFIDLWIVPERDPAAWHCVFRDRALPLSPILNHGRVFARTYEAAPNGKVVELDGAGDEIRTVVPEQSGMLRQLIILRDDVVIKCQNQMEFFVSRWKLSGERVGCLDTSSGGSVQVVATQSDAADSIFYTFESFTQPPTVFEYDLAEGRTEVWHPRAPSVSLSQPRVRDTTYRAKDGELIPITAVATKRTELAGHNAAIMTSYGGFGLSMSPQFSVLVAIMMELGATFALPHIRGGGEFGNVWHNAARSRNRQVAIDDFIAAAEWLSNQGYTTCKRLAIFGGSNSGLLVAAAMTQRPELFRAVLCVAPLLDMVRYERFDQSVMWRDEYGTAEDPEDFAVLHSYSPYHRVDDNVDYPSVLFVSGDSDDRCNPAHVRKMAARLQERKSQVSPVVTDYSEERGHSPVLPLSVRIDALARRIAFLCRELSIPVRFGGGDEATSA